MKPKIAWLSVICGVLAAARTFITMRLESANETRGEMPHSELIRTCAKAGLLVDPVC